MTVSQELCGAVLVLSTDNPPVNALGVKVRAGLLAGIERAAHDEQVKAVVIACAGRTFFAGADVNEFGKPPLTPSLSQVVAAIEALNKPVVAAIHGTALGGGCEIALACHYRVADSRARLGLPEVKLGLVPGAGGTQRLPRLTSIAFALEMIVKGEPVGAGQALAAGLVDVVTDGRPLLDVACDVANEKLGVGDLPRSGARSLAPDDAAVAQFRKDNARRLGKLEAPEAAIGLIAQAGRVPLAEGLAAERRAFEHLLASPQSAALRHMFFAERKAAVIDDMPVGTPQRAVGAVGILGAGTMGAGIAISFLDAGLPVTLMDANQAALDRGMARIAAHYQGAVAKGRIEQGKADEALARLTPAHNMAMLASLDLVIEAVFENLEVKLDIFRRLDQVMRPGAILASNTSYLDLDVIAAATGRPQDVVGLHFFSPANIMKLLEVVRGAHTAPDVLAGAMALARRIGKVAVVAGVAPGFIGNRLLRVRQNEAMRLLLEGGSPAEIDSVLTDFGLPMGPFQMTDLAGVDIGWHRDPARIETIREALCAAGRLGQKVGAGFYDYDDKRNRSTSPEVEAVIARFRTAAGITPRPFDPQEILERLLYPMVNEGAILLAEGKAQRASDIDVAWVHGYGWPAWRGGPMYWARQLGFAVIAQGLQRHGFAVSDALQSVLKAD